MTEKEREILDKKIFSKATLLMIVLIFVFGMGMEAMRLLAVWILNI